MSNSENQHGAKEPHSSCVSPVKLHAMGRKWHLGVAEKNTDATMETFAEVSVRLPLDTVAGGCTGFLFPQMAYQKVHGCPPLQQPFLLNFLMSIAIRSKAKPP